MIRKMTRNDPKWLDMTQNMTWNDPEWPKMTWYDGKHDPKYDLEWLKMTWNNMWIITQEPELKLPELTQNWQDWAGNSTVSNATY